MSFTGAFLGSERELSKILILYGGVKMGQSRGMP